MAKGKSRNGPRRRGGRKRSAPAGEQGQEDGGHNRAAAGPATGASSRLRLTSVVRDETVWEVFVVTTTAPGSRNRVLLEFTHGRGRNLVRHTRPADGPMLEALHKGTAVRRSDLERELDVAIRGSDSGAGQWDAGNAGFDADLDTDSDRESDTDSDTGPASDLPPDR